ncbi:hypothetical protein GTX14_22780 [Streptomyces sp. SID4944]|nr:hypothetical protein [Streptomyces sp. SID4944]
MALTVPPPRSSPDTGPDSFGPGPAALARWYERKLGWATEGRAPVRLLTGIRFDVLELPAEAGRALLRRPVRTGPVLLRGDRMGLLVAPGGAEELPGLLDWLEWGPVAPDLTALGPGPDHRSVAPGRCGLAGGRSVAAAPEPRLAPGPALPALAGFGSSGGDAPDLVRLVDAAATECHRVRLSHARGGLRNGSTSDQPLAFS